MAYDKLKDLAMSYPAQDRDALPLLAEEYRLAEKSRRRQERDILELASIAAEVGIDDIVNLGLEPEANSQFLEAFHSQYPNVSIDSLSGSTGERLEGLANGVKGKYFEVLCKDKLNDGGSIGDLTLMAGQKAVLAESPTQPAWDLKIVDESTGETVEALQMKATKSFKPVKDALDEHPDIRVVVTQELEDSAASRDDVIATGISNKELENITEKQLDELSEGAVANVLDNSAEFAFDFIPFGSAVFIGVSEGRRVMAGRSTFRSTLKESLKRGTGRLARSSVYSAIAKGTVVATGAGPGAVAIIPAAATVATLKVAEQRVRNREAMGRHVEEKTQEILQELESSPLGRS